VPDAVPELPVTMVIQFALLPAVHEQPEVEVTETVPVPPARPTDAEVGETL
jgi:hypothetical protein